MHSFMCLFMVMPSDNRLQVCPRRERPKACPSMHIRNWQRALRSGRTEDRLHITARRKRPVAWPSAAGRNRQRSSEADKGPQNKHLFNVLPIAWLTYCLMMMPTSSPCHARHEENRLLWMRYKYPYSASLRYPIRALQKILINKPFQKL